MESRDAAFGFTMPEALDKLVCRMWQSNPSLRPTIREVKEAFESDEIMGALADLQLLWTARQRHWNRSREPCGDEQGRHRRERPDTGQKWPQNNEKDAASLEYFNDNIASIDKNSRLIPLLGTKTDDAS